MDLAFDDAQEELRRLARQLFAQRCPTTTVRSLEETDAGFSADLWEEMARLDWVGLAHPERLGGSGGALVDLVALYMEMGRALVPSPHLASAVVSGGALAAAVEAGDRDRGYL